MKLINKIVLAKLLTVFFLMGFLSFYAVPQVDAKSDDIDIETTIQKAKQGDATAQYDLASMYAKGEGVPKDYKQAFTWCKKVAEQGHVWAQELASKIQYKIDNPSKPQKSDPSMPETEINQVNSTGTCFFVTRNGYILTCHHVIKDAKSIKIVMGETQYTAKLIRDDPHNDLALLKINGSFAAIAFSSKRSAKMGQEVFTIGPFA